MATVPTVPRYITLSSYVIVSRVCVTACSAVSRCFSIHVTIYMLIGYVTVSSFNVTGCSAASHCFNISAASRCFNIHLTTLAHWLRHCFINHVTTWSLVTSLFLVVTSLRIQRPVAVSVITSLHVHRLRHCF